MRAITPVLDSGAGPNLIHLRCVAEPWRDAIKSARSLQLIDAPNGSMKALGKLKLHVRIGQFCARAVLVRYQPRGRLYSRNYVPGPPREGDPATAEEGSVPLRAVCGADGSHILEARRQDGLEGTVAAAPAGGKFSGPEARTVPDERTVTENSCGQGGHDTLDDPSDGTRRKTGWGLCFQQNHPKTAHKNLCLMTQGIMHLFPGEPFTVLVSNFGNRRVHVPNHTVDSLAFPSPHTS